MKFIELVSILKSLAFVQLHHSLFTIIVTCLSFSVFTVPILSHIHSSCYHVHCQYSRLLILTSSSSDIQHFQFSDPHFGRDMLPWYGSTGTVVLQWLLNCPCGVRTYSPYKEPFRIQLFHLIIKRLVYENV